MIQHLLILVGNSFISFNVSSWLAQRFGGSKKIFRLAILVAIYCVIGYMHFQFYEQSKEPNYYESLEINRQFTSSQLKKAHRNAMIKYHPDKIQDDSKKKEGEQKYIEFQNMREILSNEGLKVTYDQFGEVMLPKAKKNSEDKTENNELEIWATRRSFMIIIDLSFFYAIAFILSVVLTQEGYVQKSRKFVFLVFGSFLFFDTIYVYGMADQILKEYDVFEYILPRSVFTERSYLLRIYFAVFMNFFRSVAFILDTQSIEKLHQDSKLIFRQYEWCFAKLKKDGPQNLQVYEQIAKTNQNFTRFYKALEKNVNSKEKSTSGIFYKLKKLIKNMISGALFLMTLYYVYGLFTQKQNEALKQQQEGQQ